MSHETFPRRAAFVVIAAFVFAAISASRVSAQQTLSSFDRERGREMLRLIRDDIKKDYYDPSFHGLDLDAHFTAADEKMKKAVSLGQMFGIIGQALVEFDDSHLFFVPPGRSSRYDYGWRMKMVGDRCFVTAVRPGSDAERKGLQAGDEIQKLDGFQPTRGNHWKLQYLYYALRPQPAVRLLVAKPTGEQKQYDVLTKVTEGKRVKDLTGSSGGSDLNDFIREEEDAERENRDRYIEAGDELLIWKMNEFDLASTDVDNMMGKARKHKALILDLRGNGGGAETTLLRLIANLFDHDVKLGDIKRRKETKPLVAKTRGGDSVFKGDLVVLIDSQSGSASEIFARVVQLEKRGRVVGDLSSGAVMRSRFHPHTSGVDIVAFYGASVTDADIVMTDGKSLEHVGVTPDALALPSAADMAAGRDPVLAFAASLVGVQLDAEKAGTFFPPRWSKN